MAVNAFFTEFQGLGKPRVISHKPCSSSNSTSSNPTFATPFFLHDIDEPLLGICNSCFDVHGTLHLMFIDGGARRYGISAAYHLSLVFGHDGFWPLATTFAS